MWLNSKMVIKCDDFDDDDNEVLIVYTEELYFHYLFKILKFRNFSYKIIVKKKNEFIQFIQIRYSMCN